LCGLLPGIDIDYIKQSSNNISLFPFIGFNISPLF
jgi:hypothetical protein